MIAMNELYKALAIIFIFTALFSSTLAQTTGKMNADHGRHYAKAAFDCEWEGEIYGWTQEECKDYAPMFHFLAKPFAFSLNVFNQFSIFLILVITPLILVYISREWISAWLFFTTTNYLYFFIDGAYPQALANIFAFAILIEKDWKIDIGLVLIAGLSHGYGFILALIILAAKYAHKFRLSEKILLSCSGIFGENIPKILETKVEDVIGIKATNTGNPMEVRDPIHFITKVFPIMYIYWGMKKAWKEKRIDLVLIATAGIIGGLIDSSRIFYIVPLALIPALSWWYKDLDYNQKKWFILLTIINGLFLLYTFINLKQTCQGFQILPF